MGILTGGGDCPGINAVTRAVVKKAINEKDMEVIGEEESSVSWLLPKGRNLRMVILLYRES
jgi:hypothetical protein